MARLDYRIDEKNIDPSKFIRALVTLLVQQLNTLRAFHGLTPLTRQQVIDAIKVEMRNLP